MKSLERNILRFVGIKPTGRMILGGVEANAEQRGEWLAAMETLGVAGE